jgi:hypothetical protein
MTDTYPTEPCRSCGQPVIWAVTDRQLRPIPLTPVTVTLTARKAR